MCELTSVVVKRTGFGRGTKVKIGNRCDRYLIGNTKKTYGCKTGESPGVISRRSTLRRGW